MKKTSIVASAPQQAEGRPTAVFPMYMPTEMTEQIARLAYNLWQNHGCPEGTKESDWLAAEQRLIGAR